MIINLPAPGALVDAAIGHPGLATAVLLIVLVVWPAVWSRNEARRCAASAVLAQLLSVAALFSVGMLAAAFAPRTTR